MNTDMVINLLPTLIQDTGMKKLKHVFCCENATMGLYGLRVSVERVEGTGGESLRGGEKGRRHASHNRQRRVSSIYKIRLDYRV